MLADFWIYFSLCLLLIHTAISAQNDSVCLVSQSGSGCETNDADFQKRVAFIKKVLDEVQQIASDCYVGGIRSELDVCKYNFPKDIQMELAAHLVRV